MISYVDDSLPYKQKFINYSAVFFLRDNLSFRTPHQYRISKIKDSDSEKPRTKTKVIDQNVRNFPSLQTHRLNSVLQNVGNCSRRDRSRFYKERNTIWHFFQSSVDHHGSAILNRSDVYPFPLGPFFPCGVVVFPFQGKKSKQWWRFVLLPERTRRQQLHRTGTRADT